MLAQTYTLADTLILKHKLGKAKAPSEQRLLLQQLINTYWLSMPMRAMTYVDELEEKLDEEDNLHYWQAYVTKKKADHLHLTGLVDSAIVLYEHASMQFRTADSIEQALLASCMVASLHSRQGRLEEAGKQLRAIDAETRTGDYPKALALLESRWAIYYHYQAMYDSAGYYYDAAIEDYRTLRDTTQLIRTMTDT